MEVRIEECHIEKRTQWGPVKQRHTLDRVFVNGKQAGWVPWDEKDPFHGVFHPLSGFPNELVEDVCKASGGKLTRSLKAPVPHQTLDEFQDSGDSDGDDE